MYAFTPAMLKEKHGVVPGTRVLVCPYHQYEKVRFYNRTLHVLEVQSTSVRFECCGVTWECGLDYFRFNLLTHYQVVG